jgi:hypothetical protein
MYVSGSILPIFISFDHDLVLMQAVEVSHYWWALEVVHFRICRGCPNRISSSGTLSNLPLSTFLGIGLPLDLYFIPGEGPPMLTREVG